MKYMGMPMGMWALFAGSFQKQLTAVFGYDADAAQAITKKAKPKYKAIIADLPEFEKADRFKMNIVNCAMLGAFILSMPQRPAVDRLTDYYAKAMMTAPMQWFCRKSGKSKFTAKDIAAMKVTADAAQRGAGNTMIALRTNLISNLVNICGILHFWVYSGTGNDRYLDGHSGGSGIQISVCVDSVPTGKMGDN